MFSAFLVPALLAVAADAGIPDTREIHPGTFVLKGVPGPAHLAPMKQARITHVICICRDGDPGFDPGAESQLLSDAGIVFCRVALKRGPTAADFEMFRALRNALPANARVLIHCTDGNRAAAVAVAWLGAERRIKAADALDLARTAGVVHAETEVALKAYLKLPG